MFAHFRLHLLQELQPLDGDDDAWDEEGEEDLKENEVEEGVDDGGEEEAQSLELPNEQPAVEEKSEPPQPDAGAKPAEPKASTHEVEQGAKTEEQQAAEAGTTSAPSASSAAPNPMSNENQTVDPSGHAKSSEVKPTKPSTWMAFDLL